jgi:hypothetical protein
MNCTKCKDQTENIKAKLQYGGCTSSYHCRVCHQTYVCDSSGKAGTVDGDTTYIQGPCACLFRCKNEKCRDTVPVMLIPGESFFMDKYAYGSGLKITGMTGQMQDWVAEDKIKEACLVRSTKEDGFRL